MIGPLMTGLLMTGKVRTSQGRRGQVKTGKVRTGQVRTGQVMTGPKKFLELKLFWTQFFSDPKWSLTLVLAQLVIIVILL